MLDGSILASFIADPYKPNVSFFFQGAEQLVAFAVAVAVAAAAVVNVVADAAVAEQTVHN